MASLLYRLGQWSANRAGRVITAWAALVGLALAGFLLFGGTLAAQFSIPGTETERVNEHLQAELGSSATGGAVVFHTNDGTEFTDVQREQISSALQHVAQLDHVVQIIDPFVAADQRAADEAELAEGMIEVEENRPLLTQAQQDLTAGVAQARADGAPEGQIAAMEAELEEVSTELATLEAQSAQLDLAQELAGLAEQIRTVSTDGSVALATVVFDGDAFSVPEEIKQEVMHILDGARISGVGVDYGSEIAASIDGLIGTGEIIGMVGAGLVLILVFRALRPAMLPVLASLLGVGVGVGGAMAFSDVVQMTTVTPVLGLMLGLAVGIDYSLFIIYRHRRQVRAGMAVRESIALANGTAGTAVLFAGLTTMIALLALAITGIEFLAVMGVVAAICIAIAVPVALTFTPAVLGLIGPGVLSRKAREQKANGSAPKQRSEPMGTVRAVATVVVGVAVLAVLAIPATSMRLGLPDGSSEPSGSTQHQSFTITAEAFGAGHNGPLVVAADLPQAVEQHEQLQAQVDLATHLAERADVVAVAPVGVSDDGDFMAFQVIPAEGPSSESTEALVHDLRATASLADGTELAVAGMASGNIDISDQLADALPLYVLVVFGLSVVILIAVFRSILVPVLTAAGLGLSLFAALGATTAVFQWGWFAEVFGVSSPGPLLNFLPLLLTGVLFGLAMDYQLFIASPMREAYAHGMPPRRAVSAGFEQGRVVVSVAALIMVAVFGGFAFSQIAIVRPLGFALAIGVAFDAFVVRMLIMPAAMHLLGRAAWWMPGWLDRIIPNMDVEGLALAQRRATEQQRSGEQELQSPARA